MKTIFLEDGILNGTTELNKIYHSESFLYKKDNTLYKLLKSKQRTLNREKTLNYIQCLDSKECVLPQDIIYTKQSQSNPFMGFTSEFLPQNLFKMLSEIIEDNSIPFKDRLTIAKKISALMECFERYKIVYFDLHADNIMISGTDIKFVDMDSVICKGLTTSLDYRVNLNIMCENLANLILCIIYRIDSLSFGRSILENNKRLFYRNGNEQMRRVFDKSSSHDGKVSYPTDDIDYFDENAVRDTMLKMVR